ncbi:unnamed protein product [Periconia digitata]|uniref:Uncharacterized protein n=1 Tax=Periconia digitata TaxID=1303443 RepID=A0A9W4UJ59_9PLEO|nr:unnamed protein product [Periconia digitata]
MIRRRRCIIRSRNGVIVCRRIRSRSSVTAARLIVAASRWLRRLLGRSVARFIRRVAAAAHWLRLGVIIGRRGRVRRCVSSGWGILFGSFDSFCAGGLFLVQGGSV